MHFGADARNVGQESRQSEWMQPREDLWQAERGKRANTESLKGQTKHGRA